MGTNEDMPKPEVAVDDVIQLDPDKHRWGPLFAIVDEVHDWGVRCYWLQATDRSQAPGKALLRAAHGTFVRIGIAEWKFA